MKAAPTKKSGRNKRPTIKTRPTHCTPELILKIAAVVESGVSPRSAALSLGVAKASYTEWSQKGEIGIRPYSELLAAVTQAENKSFHRAEKALSALARKGDVKAMTWFLERRYRDVYKPVHHTELSGPGSSPLELSLTTVPTDQLLKLANDRGDDDDD